MQSSGSVIKFDEVHWPPPLEENLSLILRCQNSFLSQHLRASDSAVWTIEPPLEDATLAVFFRTVRWGNRIVRVTLVC